MSDSRSADCRSAACSPGNASLHDDIRHWPAAQRYAVAVLEREGMTRAEAIGKVRAGEAVVVELPAARENWPEAALRAFWSLVKWLNATARETGQAVEGRSPFALEDGDRAVRETWRSAK